MTAGLLSGRNLHPNLHLVRRCARMFALEQTPSGGNTQLSSERLPL
jgi:hypothetical protein